MINVSEEFKLLMNERTNFKQNAEVTFADGTKLSLSEADFSVSNNSVSDAADANSIPLGVAISRSIQIELMNDDDHLLEYDFFGAKIRLFLTYQLLATVEKIEYGTFTVVAPETYGSTVIISANDDMYKADKAYSTSLTFPATIKNMLIDSCNACDIPVVSASFPNDDFVVTQKPSGEYTHRQIIGYIAMIAGGNARVNRQGYLEILPYSFDFTQEHHSLTNWKNLKVDTDDITITGIRTTYEKEILVTDSEGNEAAESQEVTILEGNEGYALSISNPLIAGQEQTAVSLIGEFLVGMTFRKFEGDHIAYPLAEFMDLAEITDRKGNVYRSFLTDVNFVFFGFTTMKNSAESGVRNSSRYFSNPTAALIEARKLIEKEKSARETAVENLAKTLADSSGLFMTEEEMGDGSFIYYAHNKPTMEESDIIWLFTAEAIGISTDGGETYPYGFTVTGEMIASILQTEGINADWINSGCLTVKNSAGVIIFQADITTGKVVINADSISIGGKAVATEEYAKELADKATNLTVLLSNEYQSIPTDSAGNYTTFPECSTAIQVLYGQTDITSQCTLSATTSAGVTGSLSGTAYKVTALTADTGWVDIKATYLGTLTAVKRFTISKVKDGAQGSNIRILNTEISMTQEEIDTNSATGYSRNWTVITSTDGLKAGDSVMIQLYNDTKGGEAYILATVNEVLSEYRINATSAGLLDKGEVGASGRVYILESSVTTIKRGQDKVPLPDEITFSAYYRDGDSASRTAYYGRFIIERSTDGNSWESVYESAADESACRYELYTAIEDGNGNYLEDGNGNVIVAWYDEDTVMMRCTLYAAGGTASALDMQTVPVVIDVAALTHMQILDLFTNGGQMEGIFVENGRVYVEASAIRVDDLCALNATIGGWVITKQAIYKEVMDAEGNKYTVYFQPPLKDYPDKTWILSCQKNSVGKFVLYSNGMAQFGSTIITPDGMIYAIKNGHIVQMKPAEDENTDVFSTGDYDEETNGYTNTAYIQANGIFHTRKVIADRAPTYPHIVGDGTYLQMSPVDGSAWGFVAESIGTGQHLRPATSGTMTLGREAFKWGQIWSTAGAISTSDKREKNNITLLDGDRWMKFLLGLRVVSYRLNDGTSGRYHHGLIANEVEELMEHLGIDSSEFAGFVKWQRTEQEEEEEIVTDEKGKKRKRKRFKDIPVYDEDGNPEYGYGLRYEEFLPMTIKAVQELYQENQKLKEELVEMKKDIKELKQMMKEVG